MVDEEESSTNHRVSPQKRTAHSINYQFTQDFNVVAQKAYEWCVNYDPHDLSLMGEEGSRKLERVSDDTVILADTYTSNEMPVTKKKLVRLDPRRLAWTSTHISGPNIHSQFYYQIVPTGTKTSRLDFRGSWLYYTNRKLTPADVRKITQRERKGDSTSWKRLAKEMEREIGRGTD